MNKHGQMFHFNIRNVGYADQRLFKAACRSLCIAAGIQRIVLNADKREWPQMVLVTDLHTPVPSGD